VTRDQNQYPTEPDQRAGISKAERQEKIAQLRLRRSKLSPEEALFLREVFRDIFDEHYKQVSDYLRRRIISRDDAQELCLDVFVALYNYICERGFPDTIPGMLTSLSRGKLSNYRQAQNRFPPSEALPSSSGSQPPRSAPDLDAIIDRRAIVQHAFSLLSLEHQEVIHMVIRNDLSHVEAAEVLELTEGQLKARLVAAKRALRALLEARVPLSQRATA